MMRCSRWALILAYLATAAVSQAQSTADRDGVGQSASPVPKARNSPAEEKARRASKPADTFKPSESIGADSAVSFPVDI